MPKNFITAFLFLLPVFAFSQTADFTFQGTSTALCTPATVSFTQNCTGNPTGFLWDFGNNVQGVGPNVSVTYTNAGYYTVTLTAIYELTSITISKQVTINPEVIPIIGFDRNYICTPGPITFTGNSSGNIANYSWDFGDSSGLINVSSPVTTHPFSSFGNYSITLVATDISGCIGQASSTIKVQKPSFVAVANPLRGCIPADVNFNASVNVPVNDFVTNYTWNFDDGSAALSGGASNVNHQYGAVGIHYPTLSITTNNGCADTFSFPPLGYGTPPTNLIAFPLKSVVCGSETPVFIAKAVNANLYSWDFGDGTSATFTDTIAQHKYNSLGIKTVTVTPLYFGCAG
ncbi:MAG: PKD domain-containing protein, partial [Ferruginibacter sp.]